MSELESNFNLLKERDRGDRVALCQGIVSASDCRALSLRCYTAAGTAKSHSHKSLLTAMGRTWVQLANQIDRLQLMQKTCPQTGDRAE